MPSSPALRVSRRATLRGTLTALGATTALATASCEDGLRRGGDTPPGATPGRQESPTPTAPGRSDEEHDAGILDRAVASTLAAEALLAATVSTHPGLGGALAEVRAVHRAHHDLLAASLSQEPPPSPAPRVPGRSRRALAVVRRHENDHQQRLADLALEARSGPFARILASMAAAVGQQVSLLPRPGEAGPA
ncbi:hypothetical protein [Nocardioides sp.]|uniref:hypothetical protein n=1 Tax=Nocardioides sp. TaxID=35761 RepID=UPI0027353F51|nr:hypothetical protein [Nocardioides sp.]MDP3890794.1 hypothetical protein [Nocardioides sp.]